MSRDADELRIRALKRYESRLERLKSELLSRTGCLSPVNRKYVESYEQELTGRYDFADTDGLMRSVQKSDIVMFGDYRTERKPKEEFLALVRELGRTTQKFNIIIANVAHNKKELIDQYIAGKVRESRLASGLGFSRTRTPEAEFVLVVLRFARERNIGVLPADSQADEAKDVNARDVRTAANIVEFSERERWIKSVMLAPDSWLARGHIPKKIVSAFAGRGRKVRITRIFSCSDKVFLRLAKKGEEGKGDLLRFSDELYLLNNSHPIARYDAFFNRLDGESEMETGTGLLNGFNLILKKMSEELGLGVDFSNLKYRIFSNYELPFIEMVLSSDFFDDSEKESILDYVERGESYFIPYAQTVYLSNLSMTHAAEEGGHYLRYLLAGLEKSKTDEDEFYSSVVNEAAAFFASKVIVPRRSPIRLAHLKAVLADGGNRKEKDAAKIHALGYSLGDKLYRAFKRGNLRGQIIKGLFTKRFKEKGEAGKFYERLKRLVS